MYLNLFLIIIGVFLIQNFEYSSTKIIGKASKLSKDIVDEEQAKQQICQANQLFSLCISQAYSQCAWCNDGKFKGQFRCDTKSAHKGKCKDLIIK
ncbi:PSI_integrin domain-containing protein [Meloidogyne graminicola]|uniref:PSI_integrin domain-containing protein n=1 Tax=Meloidogyne graminicola TaxID=189291 RepID=A0A8S9ZC78_9BILA|nr:PSI_integrin domain-containing protein [Meloidogyne graminicola]